MPGFTDFINELLAPRIAGIPIIFFLFGFVVLIIFLWKRQKKEDTYKRLNVTKEIKSDMNEFFKLSHEKIGAWIKSGAVNLGYVIEQCRLNIRADKDLSYEIKANNPQTLEAIKEVITNDKSEMPIKFYAFKVASVNILKRNVQKIINRLGFNFGLNFIIVEETLLTFSDYNIVINPYAVPKRYFDVWIYSNAGAFVIENIAFKLKQQLLIDELVNTIPKQTYLEIKQAKDMEQLNAIAKIKDKRQKDMLEEISEGKV